MKTKRLQAGFSLIEVMVAILILGIALAGLAHGITTALDSSKESEQQTVAALFAAGKIESLRAGGDLEDGETDGDCGAGLKSYRWRQIISEAGIDGLREVDVVVQSARNSQDIYELKTLLFETSGAEGGVEAPSRKKTGGAS